MKVLKGMIGIVILALVAWAAWGWQAARRDLDAFCRGTVPGMTLQEVRQRGAKAGLAVAEGSPLRVASRRVSGMACLVEHDGSKVVRATLSARQGRE